MGWGMQPKAYVVRGPSVAVVEPKTPRALDDVLTQGALEAPAVCQCDLHLRQSPVLQNYLKKVSIYH